MAHEAWIPRNPVRRYYYRRDLVGGPDQIAGEIIQALTVRDPDVGFQVADCWLRAPLGAVLTYPRLRLSSKELGPALLRQTSEKLRLVLASFVAGALVYGDRFHLEFDEAAAHASPHWRQQAAPGGPLLGAPYPAPDTARRINRPHYFPCGRGRIIVCGRDDITEGWLRDLELGAQPGTKIFGAFFSLNKELDNVQAAVRLRNGAGKPWRHFMWAFGHKPELRRKWWDVLLIIKRCLDRG